jgi:hypothetical protein
VIARPITTLALAATAGLAAATLWGCGTSADAGTTQGKPATTVERQAAGVRAPPHQHMATTVSPPPGTTTQR